MTNRIAPITPALTQQIIDLVTTLANKGIYGQPVTDAVNALIAAAPTEADFPPHITYLGETYWRTGKTGTRFADGAFAAEYSCPTPDFEARAWMTAAGEIYPD